MAKVKKSKKPAKDYSITKKISPGRMLREDLLGEVSTTDGSFLSRSFPFAVTRYNTDDLVATKGLRIYKEIAFDEQAKSALFVKKYAVTSAGWEIMPARGMDNNEAMKKSVRFIAESFDGIAGSFDACIQEIMTALDYGFSVTEKIFKVVDAGEFKKHWTLKALKTRDPLSIEFATDSGGNLFPAGIVQNGKEFPSAKFVIFSHGRRFDNWYGTSDLRATYRAWFIKDRILRFLAMTLERFGEPIFMFMPEKFITPTQRARLISMVESLQARTTMILPPGVKHEFFQGDPVVVRSMITAIEMLDRQISTSILVPRGLGVSTTDSGGGSFAKSQKEFDTFIWVVTQLRKELEAVINEQLVIPIMDLNYLVTDNTYPVFRFREITDRKKREMFELWLDAVKGGALASTKGDRVRARELIDFPQPEEGEEQKLLDKRADAKPVVQAEGDDDSDHGHDVAGSTETGKRSQSQTDDN